MSRILHVITDGGTGGAQSHVRDIAVELARRGHAVRVLAGTPGALFHDLAQAGVETAVVEGLVRRPSPRADVRAARGLAAAFRQWRPDVVHLHSSKAGLIGRLVCRRLGVRAVYTAHGWPFQAGSPPIQRALSLTGEWVAARSGGEVVCVSDAEAELGRRWRVVPRGRVTVVRNGLPDVEPEGLAHPGAGEAPPLITTLTRFALQKRPQLLVEALSRVRDLTWQCEIGGDGPERTELESLIRNLGLDGRVHLLGNVAEPAALLARTHVFVLMSRWEGLPISVIEAMRAGTAVICSDLPGTRELLDGGAGLMSPNDPDALADCLRSLLNDPARRAELGAAARSRFLSAFHLDPAVDALERVYAVHGVGAA